MTTCCSSANVLAKLLILGFTGLLLFSAVHHGMGTQSFPPTDGKLLTTSAGREIYYRCIGSDDQNPVVVLEGDTGQGIVDFMGLFETLQDTGLKICAWDRPGVGFSDYGYYEDMLRPQPVLEDFLEALGTSDSNYTGPYVFVGFGDGGRTVLEHATKTPSQVQSIILFDTLKPRFNQRALQTLTNMTKEDILDTLYLRLTEDSAVVELANFLAVPFGLAKPMYNPRNATKWSQNARKELAWFETTEKHWLQKQWKVDRSLDLLFEGQDIEIPKYRSKIPVNVVATGLNDDQIETQVCKPQKLSKEDCQLRKKMNQMAKEEKSNLAQNGKVVWCDQDDCLHDYFLYKNPRFSADQILALL